MTAAASYRHLWQLAWPIMLANAASPLLGLVDTTVIGHTGTVAQLGALALGALIFNFIYWAFGFLRMGTTGFVAHAAGREDTAELRAAAFRALFAGASFGLVLVLLRAPISALFLHVFAASADVESQAGLYLQIRLWGAPASLASFALLGVLIGLGKTREVLRIQLLLNGLNIVFDLAFALHLQMGIQGIALGTVCAEWITLSYTLWRLVGMLRDTHRDSAPFFNLAQVLNLSALGQMLHANGNIFLRTLTMLLCFGLFTNQAAVFGDAVLAANHILLQFISLSAYVLDGYAHAAEPLVGRALAAPDRRLFDHTLRNSLHLSLGSGVLMASVLLLAGAPAIPLMTTLPSVQVVAQQYLPHAAAYVLMSSLAFQLDGIFIGASATREMRNTALLSGLVFVLLCAVLATRFGYAGLWTAFIVYVLSRGLTLAWRLPALTPRAQ